MADPSELNPVHIVATGDLSAAERTVGGILGQCDAGGIGRDLAIQLLGDAGLPPIAYDDPTFPISLKQDLQILSELRRLYRGDVSLEVSLFMRMQGTRASMFGAMGMVWQSAPSVFEAIKALITYPQANWGRCSFVVSTTPETERIEYHFDKSLVPRDDSDLIEATARYAVLLEVTAGMAASLDVLPDPSLAAGIELPFAEPEDWHVVAGQLRIPVTFDAPVAAAVYRPGYLHTVPKHSHAVSFRLAMRIVGKESAILAEDTSFRNRVVRWLWASTPPLKKAEVAKILNISERSLTRQLASEGTSYNELFAEVQSERAQNFLGNPKLKISEVAYRMGYSDPAAFTRAFTGWRGITPSEWRARK